VTRNRYNEHIDPLLRELGILTYEKIQIQAEPQFMYGKNENRVVGHDLRNQNQYTLPHLRIELFRKIS
jgi:hypothetical protein